MLERVSNSNLDLPIGLTLQVAGDRLAHVLPVDEFGDLVVKTTVAVLTGVLAQEAEDQLRLFEDFVVNGGRAASLAALRLRLRHDFRERRLPRADVTLVDRRR